MSENQIILFLKSIFVISIIISFFYFVRVLYFYLITIKKWQKTEAKIIECNIKWFQSKTDSDTQGWKEMIKYNYVINSVEYENDCITKNIELLTPFKNVAEKYNFVKNQKIEIYYNPKNPKNSIIDKNFNFLTLIIPLGIYLIGYLFIF